MVAVPAEHDLVFSPPWYANGRAVALHRYLDTDFLDRFQDDLVSPPVNQFAWEAEDQTAGVLKLRRPLHRTFHIVAAEVGCRVPGTPAVAPGKVASAGFVLRYRDANGAEQGFQLVRGRPAGWQKVEAGRDPDAARALRGYGVGPGPVASKSYTGEEVHPLHATCVKPGTERSHTILFGYLPIGGAEFTPGTEPAPATSDMQDELTWPFGLLGYSGGPPPWTIDTERQLDGANLQAPFAAFLRLVLGRYRLADPAARASAENAALMTLLDSVYFFSGSPTGSAQAIRAYAAQHRTISVATWLGQSGTTDMLLKVLGPADPKQPVPAASLGLGNVSLLVPEQTAAALRAALQVRLAAAWQQTASQWPVQKHQAAKQRYYVLPFARTVRPDGCERIYWGQPSREFLLAATFDPEATRPVLIQMPDISDATRGIARGASFAMPKKLANFMNAMTGKDRAQDVVDGKDPSGSLDFDFICSFSIPAITICAMFILTIIISLLNIVFFWLPFVKICLPVPKGLLGKKP